MSELGDWGGLLMLHGRGWGQTPTVMDGDHRRKNRKKAWVRKRDADDREEERGGELRESEKLVIFQFL